MHNKKSFGNNNGIEKERRFIMRTNGLDYTILTIVIIGAINWGLIGFFGFDLINVVFGNMTLLSRIIYAIVGLSGLYALTYYGRMQSMG